MDKFILHSPFKATGDQPKAIDELVEEDLEQLATADVPGYLTANDSDISPDTNPETDFISI